MKILSAKAALALDALTIAREPITSIDLMERASLSFVNWFINAFPDEDQPIVIFCGTGNNGGDGLAIARLLHHRFYTAVVYYCNIGKAPSADAQINIDRLPPRKSIPFTAINKGDHFPDIPKDAIVIDAIFGIGLNRPVEGYWADLFLNINKYQGAIVAVDIPSGVFADQHTNGVSIEATHTFGFEFPRLAFCFPENAKRLGAWKIGAVQLDPKAIADADCKHYYIDKAFAKKRLRKRKKYDHKGTFGHALLIAGSYGKVGAAILAAKAMLRSGTGLVSIHAPKCAYQILQMSVPEAMISIDSHEYYFAEIPDLARYKSIGIGCGLDTKTLSVKALEALLDTSDKPIVLDADALNIISKNQRLLSKIPKDSILTPHPKEFSRLFGNTNNDFERHQLQVTQATTLNVYIVLKGANTCIVSPDGNSYFNSTGNPGMATAGSGDVLTGIITGLLAQGYSACDAAILGVFLHGLAGDIAVEVLRGQEALIASDLIEYLGAAFRAIY